MAIELSVTEEQRARADLLTVLLAREINDDSIVVMGTGTPLTAVATLLALRTHATNAYYTSPLAGALSIAPHDISFDRMEQAVFEHASVRSAQIIDLWELATINPKTADRWLQFFRPAQMDVYGNINNSLLRRPDGSQLRLPGSVGISDMAAFYPRLYAYVPRHGRSVFPDRVDFVSAPGTLGTVEQRKQRGLLWGRPYKVITDLCTMGFSPEGRMIVTSLHPGRSPERVQEATGFRLDFAAVEPTPAPTGDEKGELARIDPGGMRFLEVLPARERQRALRRLLAARST